MVRLQNPTLLYGKLSCMIPQHYTGARILDLSRTSLYLPISARAFFQLLVEYRGNTTKLNAPILLTTVKHERFWNWINRVYEFYVGIANTYTDNWLRFRPHGRWCDINALV